MSGQELLGTLQPTHQRFCTDHIYVYIYIYIYIVYMCVCACVCVWVGNLTGVCSELCAVSILRAANAMSEIFSVSHVSMPLPCM